MFHLRSATVRVHQIDIGGRSYVSHLSNPVDDDIRNNSQDYTINGAKHLVVKSDGIGIVDVAFELKDGQPSWILNKSSQPFAEGICQIRDANLQSLRIIRDVWTFSFYLMPANIPQPLKCRAIIPSNRTGAEPYFCRTPIPSYDLWVDSGFLVESKLTEYEDPFIYFTQHTSCLQL